MLPERCGNCKYFQKRRNWSGLCLYHVITIKNKGGDNAKRYPTVSEKDSCEFWEEQNESRKKEAKGE